MEATDLLLWGLVVHLVVDWLGQNEWQALNKMKRWPGRDFIWLRHPAAYVHAGLHGWFQLLVFPWWGALLIAITHLLIDTRIPVKWWSEQIGQTQPSGQHMSSVSADGTIESISVYDMGTEVRVWADQTWHIGVLALLALMIGL
jgi:hypothetical protein